MISIEAAREYYHDHDSAHGFDHVLRVWRLAERIGREEGADMELLQAAALLHDVSRADEARSGISHAEAGAARAMEILAGQPVERVAAVADIIAQHRFRAGKPPDTLEARILFDADKLDAIGAIGVARAYAVAGSYRQKLWARVPEAYAERAPEEGLADLGSDDHTPVHEYLFKLSRLAERMYTPTARRLAAERHRFMADFFAQLEAEVAGER